MNSRFVTFGKCEAGWLIGAVVALVLTVSLSVSPCMAQWNIWSSGFGDANQQMIWSVATDGDGNVAVTGGFEGSIDLGGDVLTSAGNFDAFVAMFDNTGNHLWSTSFGYHNESEDKGYGVCFDPNGDVFVTGRFAGSVDFGDGNVLDGIGYADIFVAKYTGADGACLWSKNFGNYSVDIGWGICTDSLGDVYVVGEDDQGAGAGNIEVYIAKLRNSDGYKLAEKWFHEPYNDAAKGVCVDANNNLIVTGYFESGTIDFGGGALTNNGGKDIFVVTFDSSLNHLSSQSFGGLYDDEGHSITTDEYGRVFFAGQFGGTVDFTGPSPGSPLVAVNSQDAFLVSLTSTVGGVRYHRFSKGFGGGGYDSGKAVDFHDGYVYMSGYFHDSINLGGASFNGDDDAFLAKFDVDLDHDWSIKIGASGGGESGESVSVDDDGFVFLGGFFKNTVDFGNGNVLTSNGDWDAFLSKYSSGDLAIANVEVTTVFDSGTETWDATFTFETTAPTIPTVEYDRMMDCYPCDYSESIAGQSGMQHVITLYDLPASTEYCYKITADYGSTPFPDVVGSFELTNSYQPIYDISHTFNSSQCKISVEWSTKFPSTDNKVYYKKLSAITWQSVDPIQGEDCDDERYYFARIPVEQTTTYQFKVYAKIDGATVNSITMTRSSTACGLKDPPRPLFSPDQVDAVVPFVRAVPNPFNPTTTITYNVPAAGNIDISVYAADGSFVKRLVSGHKYQGAHSVLWDSTSEAGDAVATGVYFVKFAMANEVLTSKIVLLK